MTDRTHLNERLRTHPVVARLLPHLDGQVSVVGGVVRDALLGRVHLHDVDLVVEGDAIALAQRVAARLGAPVVAHGRFGTAVIELPHGEGHVDFITARSERYPAPGALPVVSPASLDDDLARRDFTINAMAVRLAGPGEGDLVDPHGGLEDLEAQRIRSLRPGAFVEDPSRIVRAARYAGRLGFHLDADTGREFEDGAGRLDWRVSRVADELRRVLEEADPGPALALLAAVGAPGITHDAPGRVAAIDRARGELAAGDPHAVLPPRWALAAAGALERPFRSEIALPGWARGVADEVADGARVAGRLARTDRPSEVDAIVHGVPVATLVGAIARGAPQVMTWWTTWRVAPVAIRGADLIAAGVAPGPAIGRALAEVRAAVLDGTVTDTEDQLALAIAAAGRADA
jgi:tRNA nucleotidyltransferase (CCA-adding enzyme)